MRYIDLRSDTVTMPTDEMRRAMASAELGDDVYGDDPTVNELQNLAADMLGKEAALFVPSGTMGNQVSILTHTRRGQEMILSDDAHICVHESGAAAMLSGVMIRTVHSDTGLPQPEKYAAAIREGGNVHYPITGLIEMENPTSMGKVVPLETMKRIYGLAHEKGIPVHLDGARLFHAAEALHVDVKEITQYCDSVMACLSKGLCAPVGSVLAGSRAFIDEALRNRKMLGGGMRQAGVIAAAGIIALRDMTKRLGDDHANAKYMAQRLAQLPGVTVDLESVVINMVFFKIDKPAEWHAALPARMLERGVRINGEEDGLVRFVTNNGVTRDDVDTAIGILAELLQ